MCHLTVLEAGDDGKARLENETSSEAKYVRNFVSGPKKKDNSEPGPNKSPNLQLKRLHQEQSRPQMFRNTSTSRSTFISTRPNQTIEISSAIDSC